MFWGTILIVVGLVALLKNLGIITADTWGIIWPVLVIALGLSFITKRRATNHTPRCYCPDCIDKNK